MPHGLIEYDPARIHQLVRQTRQVVDHLARLGPVDDPLASAAASTARSVRTRIEAEWLPLLTRIASSTAMTEFATVGPGRTEIHAASTLAWRDDDPRPSVPALFDEATEDAGQWPNTRLPTGGEFPFEPARGDHGRPKKLRGNQGYEDKHGNKWRIDKEKPWVEWDVTPPRGGGHWNVDPHGHITHRWEVDVELNELSVEMEASLCATSPSCTAAAAAAAAAAVVTAIWVFGT